MILGWMSMLSFALAFAAPSVRDDGDLPEPLRGLVGAERAFSKFSSEHGIKPAFLEFLGDDAIVFAPRAVLGKDAYKEQPDEPEPRATLVWRPVFADIAASGDFGYTTGPYELSFVRDGKPAKSYGHYVTVWKKTGDGPWRVAIDKGIRHPEPSTAPDEVEHPPEAVAAAADRAARLEDLLAQDRELEEKGFEAMASASVRLYRDGAFPIAGKREALSKRDPAPGAFAPEGGAIAPSGDLGFTYGTASSESAGPRSYLHIWKREGSEWRLVLDNDTPLPPGS